MVSVSELTEVFVVETVAVIWVLLSSGVLLAGLELEFGSRGSCALAILWPLVLAVLLVGAALCAVVACVWAVCWVPVALVAAARGRSCDVKARIG